MEYQKLKDLIENKINGEQFLSFYNEEILAYVNSSSNKDSVPIYSNVFIKILTEKDLVKIFELYIKDIIFEWDLEYILSFLEMSYLGDNEKIEKVIFNFANPYLNFYISKENINRTIRYLKRETLNLQLESVDIRLKQKEQGYRPNYKSKVLD